MRTDLAACQAPSRGLSIGVLALPAPWLNHWPSSTGVPSFQDGDAEASDLLEEDNAVRRGLAGAHLGTEQGLTRPLVLLELLAGLYLGQGQGVVVVVLYDLHIDNCLF